MNKIVLSLSLLFIFTHQALSLDSANNIYTASRLAKMKGSGAGGNHRTGVWTIPMLSNFVAKVTYVNGVPHGPYRSYYPNGVLHMSGQYDRGKRTGHWTQWSTKGPAGSIKRVEALYDNDILVGNYTLRHTNGKKSYTGHFANGLKHGVFKTYRVDGKLRLHESFKLGKLNGNSIHYYDNGKVKSSTHYTNGKRHGDCTHWYDNTKVKSTEHYVNELKHGNFKYFDSNGKLQSQEGHSNGKRHGYSIAYFDNGKVKSATHYVNGIKEGKSFRDVEIKGHWGNAYFRTFEHYVKQVKHGEAGELERKGGRHQFDEHFGLYSFGHYNSGKRHGRWQIDWITIRVFKENHYKVTERRVIKLVHYDKGALHGPYNEYHQNKRLRIKGNFHHGRQQGLWHEYHDNGRLKTEINFNNGKPLSVKNWDSQGKQK